MQRGSRHVLSHAAIYLVARGLPGIVAFCAIPLFTRLIDPGAYGRYAMVLATVAMLNALLFQWLRLSLARYLAAYQGNEAKLKGTLVTTASATVSDSGKP
jgi:O-antigen/teichoic acid export membrane protein